MFFEPKNRKNQNCAECRPGSAAVRRTSSGPRIGMVKLGKVSEKSVNKKLNYHRILRDFLRLFLNFTIPIRGPLDVWRTAAEPGLNSARF